MGVQCRLGKFWEGERVPYVNTSQSTHWHKARDLGPNSSYTSNNACSHVTWCDTERWTPPPRSVGVQYATGKEQRNSSRKNEEAEPNQKWHPVVDVSGGESKVWWHKEQYCIGNWNIRSMNQGKLEAVKQEMTRVNIDILGISELKWTGMGEFRWPLYLLLWARIP